MSGAYTHIAAANSARERAKDVDLRDSTNFVLGRHLRYVELGALSPDYPYLSMTQHQSRWADEMHYTHTALFIRNAVAEVRRHSGLRQQKLTAWLFGVASHTQRALLEDTGCTARMDSHRWTSGVNTQCEFTLNVEAICGR